jgi:hypothetical protein
MYNIQNNSQNFDSQTKIRIFKPANKYFWLFLSLFTAVIIILTSIIYNDAQQFDTTQGGYSYPYSDYTGSPYNFNTFELNSVGFRKTDGLILEFQINCTTGMITGFLGPIAIDYRVISERAIMIHKPQVACKEKGFNPQWKY